MVPLRCKQGDLAVVIKSEVGNESKVCRCLKFVGSLPYEFGFFTSDDFWLTDSSFKMEHGVTGAISYIPYMRDSQLMPISPSDEQKDEFSKEVDDDFDFELKEFYGNTLALVPK